MNGFFNWVAEDSAALHCLGIGFLLYAIAQTVYAVFYAAVVQDVEDYFVPHPAAMLAQFVLFSLPSICLCLAGVYLIHLALA